METFKDRLITEKTELDIKIEKLSAFINDKQKFVTVAYIQQELLKLQLDSMMCYSKTLGLRITYLT
jgi:hypothetical protein